MKKTEEFELKLAGGKVVTWEGESGEDAARRYAENHRGVAVIAWRYPKTELRIGMIRIVQ